MEKKVIEWINQLEILSKIAAIEPRAMYCAFVGGFKHKVTYTFRIVPNTRKHLEKLDQAVDKKIYSDPYWWSFMQRNGKEATITSCKIW